MNLIPRTGKWGSIVTILNQNIGDIENLLGPIGASIYLCLGQFTSIEELSEKILSPQIGSWAIIGTEFPGNIWIFDKTNQWKNLGTSPFNPDISNYPESEQISNSKWIL